jgi:hypothetical protein
MERSHLYSMLLPHLLVTIIFIKVNLLLLNPAVSFILLAMIAAIEQLVYCYLPSNRSIWKVCIQNS